MELKFSRSTIRSAQAGLAMPFRGPLGIHREVNRRFWFYGANHTLDAQMAYLKALRRVTEIELRRHGDALQPAAGLTRINASPEV